MNRLMLQINDKKINVPLMLAPMMDITGYAFRKLIRTYGGCDLFYSEMLNAKKVIYEKKDHPLFKGFDEEKDLVFQLLGNDPEIMCQAIKRLEEYQPFGFDLNLGCSRAVIVNQGWGAGLGRDLKKASSVIRAMRRCFSRFFSVKLRNCWRDEEEAKAFITMLQDEGVDMIIVHPRTTEKIFARPAKWSWIGQVKSWTNLPVIGNGDIKTVHDALTMRNQSGCDGLMLGRGAVARPTLFAEINAAINEKEPMKPIKPSLIFKKMIELFGEELTQPKRVKELRLFCRYFSESLPVPHWFWGPIQTEHNPDIIVKKSLDFLERNNL